MDWQLLIVGLLVLLALVYLGRQTLRTWRGKSAGCGGCKCGPTPGSDSALSKPTMIPRDQLRLRRR